MKKIGITADCSSGVEYAPFKHNIKITRTTINFNGQILTDGIDVTADQFYEMLENSDIVPTTAAPLVGEINKRCLEWKEEGATETDLKVVQDALVQFKNKNISVTIPSKKKNSKTKVAKKNNNKKNKPKTITKKKK